MIDSAQDPFLQLSRRGCICPGARFTNDFLQVWRSQPSPVLGMPPSHCARAILKFDANFALLQFRCWPLDRNKVLHMARRAMYKIL